MPLLKRSYERKENMLDGKNFICRNLYGDLIEKNIYKDGYDVANAQKNLTFVGKQIIKTFIEQNKMKSDLIDKRNTQLYQDLHSKKPKSMSIDYRNVDNFKIDIYDQEKPDRKYYKKIKRPNWKLSLHCFEEFSPPLIDKEYIFDKPKKRKYDVNQPPFKRPKEKGDYFDLHIF